jgi:hypothetical protein
VFLLNKEDPVIVLLEILETVYHVCILLVLPSYMAVFGFSGKGLFELLKSFGC